MPKEHEKFMVSQWGVLIRDNKCLILRPPEKEYWELPGGRIEKDELLTVNTETAFRREISEELGLTNFEIMRPLDWMIGHSMKNHTPICRLIYLIKNDTDEIKLSFEHAESKWITFDEVSNYQYNPLINAKDLGEILKSAFKNSQSS